MKSELTQSSTRFKFHIFICTNERPAGHLKGSCKTSGSEKLVSLFKEELFRRGLKGLVRAQSSGCLDACSFGPAVVVYPQGIWYVRVKPSDVPEIIQALLDGRPPICELLISGKF